MSLVPSNHVRANWACQALEAHFKAKGEEFDIDYAVRDLIADLMHLCRAEVIDFEDELRIARLNFDAEVNEE